MKIFACVVNWFDQSIYLNQSDYQHILDRLESDPTLNTLVGVEGILFITKMGEHFLFLNEQGRLID